MTSRVLLSGLPREECRRVLGDAAWAAVERLWREPGDLAQAALAGSELVWLYRSPAAALMAGAPPATVGDLLEAWAVHNRGGINLRRGGPARLSSLDVEVADADHFRRVLPIGADIALPASAEPTVPPELRAPLAWLLEWAAPQVATVHHALEAIAITGRAGDRDVGAPEMDALLPLVDAVRRGAAPAFSAAVAAIVGEKLQEDLRRERARADHRGLQLQQAREELDLCHAQVRSVEQRLAERESDWREAHAMRDEATRVLSREEQLLFQLQVVREELEQQHVDFTRLLDRERQALEAEQAERARAGEELRALRVQLDFVLEEMRSRTTLPVPYASPATLPRLRDGFKRQVLGRLHRRWSPAVANAQAERSRAIEEIATSRWFQRDWYLSRYGDVAAAAMEPAEHYYEHGWREGRDPGPEFSTRFYIEAHPDVAESGMVPLLHFLRHGLQEGRLPRSPGS